MDVFLVLMIGVHDLHRPFAKEATVHQSPTGQRDPGCAP
jgi:hypothetical protein